MRKTFATGHDALARLSRTRTGAEDRALLDAGLHSRRLVLLKSLQRRVEDARVPPETRTAFVRHWRVLADAERRDPTAVGAVLGYPSVGVWLVGALGEPAPATPRTLAHFGAVAAAAALRARAGYRGTLDTPDGVLTLPGLGVYRTRAPRVRLVAGPHSLRLAAEGGRPVDVALPQAGRRRTADGGRAGPPGWSALVPLPGTGAVLDGVDPYRLPRSGTGLFGLVPPHPAPRAGAGEGPWLRRWRAALTLLASSDPGRAAEVIALVRAVVPLEPGPGAADSATLRAAPGAVFTTCPPTALRLAEVLVHEVQHGKLAVVTDLAALHEGGDEAVHRVGWRPDPRPLAGVFQGTYAHLALADFAYRLAARSGATPAARKAARARGDACREQVGEALALLLGSVQLTPLGRKFAIGMREHHTELGKIGDTGIRTAQRQPPVRTFR